MGNVYCHFDKSYVLIFFVLNVVFLHWRIFCHIFASGTYLSNIGVYRKRNGIFNVLNASYGLKVFVSIVGFSYRIKKNNIKIFASTLVMEVRTENLMKKEMFVSIFDTSYVLIIFISHVVFSKYIILYHILAFITSVIDFCTKIFLK